MAVPFISVQNAGKVYRSERGDIVALQDIEIDIKASEFISIVGPSGCGKSTLLRCIGGLQPLSTGVITIDGHRVDSPPADTGFVFQRDVLLDWRTVMDNVLLPAEFRRLDCRVYRERALELLSMIGLDGFEKRYPWELSGGMRQRVAICRSLLLDPALLLMDEPFGALDAITRDELNLELERIWENSKKTILFVTHGISEAVFLSSRVVVMGKNPGTIERIVSVDLPRPRSFEIRETREFSEYAREIRGIFERIGVIRKL